MFPCVHTAPLSVSLCICPVCLCASVAAVILPVCRLWSLCTPVCNQLITPPGLHTCLPSAITLQHISPTTPRWIVVANTRQGQTSKPIQPAYLQTSTPSPPATIPPIFICGYNKNKRFTTKDSPVASALHLGPTHVLNSPEFKIFLKPEVQNFFHTNKCLVPSSLTQCNHCQINLCI